MAKKKRSHEEDDVPLFDRCRSSRGMTPDSFFDADPRYDHSFGDDDESLAEEIAKDPDLQDIRESALEVESENDQENNA